MSATRVLIAGVATVNLFLLSGCGDGAGSTDSADNMEGTGQTEDGSVSFEGERISWIVAAEAGGTGDPHVRVAARHLPRFLPGEPNITVENRTGGSHNIAANYLFNEAPSDGTTLGSFGSHRHIASAIGEEGVNFSSPEFNWVATLWGGGSVCTTWHESSIQDITDLAGSETWIVGTSSATSAGATSVSLLSPDLGWNSDLILGYEGNTEVYLAMQQGEVNGLCLPWNLLQTFGADAEEKVRPLFVFGTERLEALPDIPSTAEEDIFPLSEAVREAVDAYSSRFAVNVTVALPPDTPQEVVETYRDAFDQLRSDPEFLADMEEAGLPVEGNLSGEETHEIIQRMHDASPEAWQLVLEAQQGN